MDGSGKSTQLKLLREKAKEAKLDVVFTREPGGSPAAEKVRDMLLYEDTMRKASARTRLFLFAAARSDHMERTVLPNLLAGRHIFSDRGDSSTLAYQIYADQGRDLEPLFWATRKMLLRGAEPDMYIIFNLSPEEARRRVFAAERSSTTHFDEKPLSYYKAVWDGFRAFQKSVSQAVLVNADRPPDEIHKEVASLAKRTLGVHQL
jgi:dTMP kinase